MGISRIGNYQCYVAMWSNPDLEQAYEQAISPGILAAGYLPCRTERKGAIDDEVISQIRKSRFVLVDFTGHRSDVYYKAGFAKGLNREIIWTCRKDVVGKLIFDASQYNIIVWRQERLDDFRDRIYNRIEAVLGHGHYWQSNDQNPLLPASKIS